MKYLSIIIFFLTSGLIAQDQPAYVKITLQDGQELLVSLVSETDSTLTTKNLDGEIGTVRKGDILKREDITTYAVVTSAPETVPPAGLRYILTEALLMKGYTHPQKPWQARVGYGQGSLVSLTRSFHINILDDLGFMPTISFGILELEIPWLIRDYYGTVFDSAYVSLMAEPFVSVGLDWTKKIGPSHLTLKVGYGGRAIPEGVKVEELGVPLIALGMELGHGPYSLEIQSFQSPSTSNNSKYRANIYSFGYTSPNPFKTIRLPAFALAGGVLLKIIWFGLLGA